VTTSVSSKGQIVIPAELRRRDKIRAGQKFSVVRLRSGDYRITRAAKRPNIGLVDLLLSCPVKGVLEPIKSESTDTL
jgi:AbrB family looped-hinge helix DNA binding protein